MLSGFVTAICQIGIFMICAQAIVHFRPKASYEKYLKMLVSSMILIRLIASVAGLLGGDGEVKLFERAQEFSERMEESMHRASEITFFAGEDVPLQIMGEDPDGGESDTENGIRDISVKINSVSPIQIDVN